MRPVAGSIRVNPPAVTQTDPRPTARPHALGVEVDRGDDLARDRVDADGLREPVRPCLDADPDLRAVTRHRAVQRHPQPDLVRRGIDPHHLTHVGDAHPDAHRGRPS